MKTAENFSAAAPSTVATPKHLLSAKIQPTHLERVAIVYVRQSTQKQVLENRESAARQYAFAEQAVAFGWPRGRVLVIDEDLGKTGRTAEGRSGFQRLVTEVTLNHVGLVLGLEMSRLARSMLSNLWRTCSSMRRSACRCRSASVSRLIGNPSPGVATKCLT